VTGIKVFTTITAPPIEPSATNMTEKAIGASGASLRSKHDNHRIVKKSFIVGVALTRERLEPDQHQKEEKVVLNTERSRKMT
jgi:hypothetical protein